MSNGSICGGKISWTKWVHQTPEQDMASLMCLVRKRVHKNGHYKYKIIDQLGDCWWWE